MVVLLCTFAFWSVRTRAWWSEAKGIKRDCNWLDLDKVSLKLVSKNLVRSKFKPRFKIFSVLFKRKGFSYGLLQAENIRSARCSRVLLSILLAARKANFYLCSCSQRNRSARHARQGSQRPFVTPDMHPQTTENSLTSIHGLHACKLS